MKATIFSVLMMVGPNLVLAQGQDSQPFERDLQVIRTMLPGAYDNANQNYFDRRGDRSVKHRRVHITVSPMEEHPDVFVVNTYWDNEMDAPANVQVWRLSSDEKSESVRMQSWKDRLPSNVNRKSACDLYWRREAEQFRATAEKSCDSSFPNELVLGYKQFWVNYPELKDGDLKLHRARGFECYADIPGVGGGRDEPYERYEGFKIHDQGGAVWFDAKDGRRLGISLFLVDWPINNYEGIFTRDSFVIYVSEEIDGERKEHGYAFTVPEVDRLGINLKWMLASCFMKSNKFATPKM